MSILDEMTPISIFLTGCIGAAAPEIVRLYNLRFKAQFKWSWKYLILSIPLFLLGGFTAWILKPTSLYAAFYSGVTTPVLITTIVQNTGQTVSETTETKELVSTNKETRVSKGTTNLTIKHSLRERELTKDKSNKLASSRLFKDFWNAL